MAKGTIGGKIVLEGDREYSAALKRIKAEKSELRSEMKLCQSEFRNYQNSMDALSKKHEILTRQVAAQTKEVEVNRQAMEASEKKQEKVIGKINDLQAALAKAEKEMGQMSDSSEDNSEALEAQSKSIDDLKEKLRLAEESYNKAGEKARVYQTSMNNANAALNVMKEELEETARQMREAELSGDHCATSIDRYGKETEEATEKTALFGDMLRANLASEAILAGIKKLADGIRKVAVSAVDVGSEVEASMSQVAATMGMTADEINSGSREYEKLSEAAKACGKTTKYSASEAAEALNYLALAGYDVDKSVETLPKVLDLAAAGGLDLAYASDLVTDSMAALGLETEELDKYIDQMARTSQKSNTSVAQLGEATLVCAGTVTLTGQKLETMNAELGILANNGIKGAEGGTHLRNILLALSAPTEKAGKELRSLGVDVGDANGNMRDLNDIMTDLNVAMDGMSSTEKTQLISQIFNKTDIAAVNALLKGTGEEFENLSEELKDCVGAAGDMAVTMNNNLKGKVTILKSSLEALGISAYEVFDDNMKTAVEGATDAVGRLQRSIETGDLGVSLNKLSESLGEFCQGAIDVGEDALPVLIDGLTWVLDHSDLVTAGITGIVAANMQMKVVGPAIDAVQTAWHAYKAANEGATVSQWLLNAAMTANPAGLLLGAIAGLTAAVAAFILINKDNLSGITETEQKTKELTETTQKLNEEYAASKAAREKTRTGMEQESSAAKKLVGELSDLQKKTNLTVEDEIRQKQIIEELNTAYPELNLKIDEQTGLLNMTTDAIYANIDALSALDKANAAREDMKRIAEEQWEAEKALLDLQEQRDVQAVQLAEAQEQLNSAMANMTEYSRNASTELMPYVFSIDSAQEALDALDAQIAETEGSITGLSEEYQYCYEYISENEGIYQTAEATGQLGSAAREAGTEVSGMAEEVSQSYGEMYDTVSETVQNQISLFAEFKGQMELTSKELLDNMQSQVDGITQWADNMETLAERGIDQGLLQHLADLGPEGAGYVATFVSMTDEELQKANELFEQTLSIPDETAAKVTAAYEMAGKQAAEGFQTGIKDSAAEVENAAGDMAHGTVDIAMKILDEHSPSKVFETIGANVDLGMAAGIRGNRQQVMDMVIQVCSSVLQTGRQCVVTRDWEVVGKRIPEGMKVGIEAGTASVVAAIESMAARAVEAAQKKLEIHSPSKKFEWMGEMSGEGYIAGWQQSTAGIEDVIAVAFPDASMPVKQPKPSTGAVSAEKTVSVQQEINIYSPVDDPIEAARRFRDSQREAAEAW